MKNKVLKFLVVFSVVFVVGFLVNHSLGAGPSLSFTSSSYNIGYGKSVTLSWSSPGATHCKATGLWSGNRKPASGSEVIFPSVANNRYSITCYSSGGSTAKTLWVHMRSVSGAPLDPSKAKVSYVSNNEATLSWRDNSSNEVGFKVERKDVSCSQAGTFNQVGTVGSNVISYQDSGLRPNKKYCYRVRAYNSKNSRYSNWAYGKTLKQSIPTTPSNLVASANTPNQISLSWKDNSSNETGFKIYRSVNNCSNLTEIAEVGANTTSYIDQNLNSGTLYCYGVKSYIRTSTTAGLSSYSNLQSTTPPTLPKTVVLIIDKDFKDDPSINSKIQRYKNDYSTYNFEEILFKKSSDPITNLKEKGGSIKKNSLEVRNTLQAMYLEQDEKIIGVWVIGNIRPMIWRDKEIWRDLGQSGFYPSIYPFTALSQDYYNDFDVQYDGFYEKPGITRGSAVGDGYNSEIWGAVLIPPTNDLETGKDLIGNFFDRDHNYLGNVFNYSNALVYSDTWGCSSKRVATLNNSGFSTTILCPNFNEALGGFNSAYHFIIRDKNSPDPGTTGSWSPLTANTTAEIAEYSDWTKKQLFENSVLQFGGNTYEFILVLKGRSEATESIRNVILNNLPPQLCDPSVRTCDVYVGEAGFREDNVNVWDGHWTSYLSQQTKWNELYDNVEKNQAPKITYINTHGNSTSHYFGINSDKVKNANYSSLVYEIEACNVADYREDYIAGNYLFYGNALAVSGYSIPYVVQGIEGYYEGEYSARFLNIGNDMVINKLFLKNYGNSIYLGDPLLVIK